jgi:hypothetical protein
LTSTEKFKSLNREKPTSTNGLKRVKLNNINKQKRTEKEYTRR